MSLNASSIIAWYTDGALHKPKGIRSHSYSPSGVINAVFSTLSGCMLICQNPDAASS